MKIWNQHARQQEIDFFSIALDFCRKRKSSLENKKSKTEVDNVPSTSFVNDTFSLFFLIKILKNILF